MVGRPAKIIGLPVPDWVGTAAPMIGQELSNKLVAIQVRARASHPDFRSDLVEKFGAPVRENQVSYRNSYGKESTAPELEWNTKGLHVQFVPDSAQGNEPWGVLLIETDAAYKARREFDTKAHANRPKI